jgi:hypothetical protein
VDVIWFGARVTGIDIPKDMDETGKVMSHDTSLTGRTNWQGHKASMYTMPFSSVARC